MINYDMQYETHEFDERLKKQKFYGIMPLYMPYVGVNYEKYRILQVGESHYIPQQNVEEGGLYTEKFSEEWWNSTKLYCEMKEKYYGKRMLNTGKKVEEIDVDIDHWISTRFCVWEFITHTAGRNTYNIYRNTLKEFSNVILGKGDNDYISMDYTHFAFMNFFQMPSLIWGLDYKNSLYKCKGSKDSAFCDKVYEETVGQSVDVLRTVVRIIEPKLIVFTSVQAYNAYSDYCRKHGDKEFDNILNLDHPGCSWWNKGKQKYSNKSSKQRLRDKLKEIYK